MEITRISQTKKGRFALFSGEEFLFSLDPETFFTQRLAEGDDLAADELELYLDTHCDDSEAFAMYQTFLALKKEARSRYVKQYGPISQDDMLGAKCYDWLKEPWPWDYQSKMEV